MKTGRPPQWNPVATLSDTTWTEVVSVTSKSRVQLPMSARARLNWGSATEPMALLARLEPDKSARLEPWDPAGEVVMGAIEAMLASEPEQVRAELAIVAMDRYVKVTLDPDGRITMPANLAHHIDAVGKDAVRVIVSDGRLRLWSEIAWQLNRSSRLRSLGGRLLDIEKSLEN